MKLHRFLFFFAMACSVVTAQAASVSIAWSRNTESDLLGYRVHYGTRSRAYTTSRDVGNVNEYTLSELQSDSTYYIALTALDVWGNESAFSEEVVASPEGGGSNTVPWRFELASAYPNPARPGSLTKLEYALPEAREEITVAVYNALGQRVRTLFTGPAVAGYHTQYWDSRDDFNQPLAAGIYYVRLQTGLKILTTPVTLLH
jgi:hypothetical protein